MNTRASPDKLRVACSRGRAGNPVRPWILRRLEFIFAAIALLVLLWATGLLQEFATRILTRYPESWASIRPGMTSTEARAILGEPTADGRQLKSLDRWLINRKGVTMHLDLWFDDAGEHMTIARVSLHKRLWGRDTEKSVILPHTAGAP